MDEYLKNNKFFASLQEVEKIQQTVKTECFLCAGTYYKNDSRRLPCNHVMHEKCINKWLLQEKTCPLCRKPVK